MDKITGAKTEFRLRQWAKVIQSCQTSDMTVIAWCNQNNVNVKSYYYWLRKIRTIACESKELQTGNNDDQPIVPLAFTQAKESAAAITIHLPSVSIDIQDGASKTTIEAVLAALKSVC